MTLPSSNVILDHHLNLPSSNGVLSNAPGCRIAVRTKAKRELLEWIRISSHLWAVRQNSSVSVNRNQMKCRYLLLMYNRPAYSEARANLSSSHFHRFNARLITWPPVTGGVNHSKMADRFGPHLWSQFMLWSLRAVFFVASLWSHQYENYAYCLATSW